MDGSIMNRAMATSMATDKTEQNPDVNYPKDEAGEDGTVTVPEGVLPESVKEGDIIQMEVLTQTSDGFVLKPVESRVKQPGEPAESEKVNTPGEKVSLDDAVNKAMTLGKKNS
jgi:hypothetical protein